jgi:hypothetical protein
MSNVTLETFTMLKVNAFDHNQTLVSDLRVSASTLCLAARLRIRIYRRKLIPEQQVGPRKVIAARKWSLFNLSK